MQTRKTKGSSIESKVVSTARATIATARDAIGEQITKLEAQRRALNLAAVRAVKVAGAHTVEGWLADELALDLEAVEQVRLQLKLTASDSPRKRLADSCAGAPAKALDPIGDAFAAVERAGSLLGDAREMLRGTAALLYERAKAAETFAHPDGSQYTVEAWLADELENVAAHLDEGDRMLTGARKDGSPRERLLDYLEREHKYTAKRAARERLHKALDRAEAAPSGRTEHVGELVESARAFMAAHAPTVR